MSNIAGLKKKVDNLAGQLPQPTENEPLFDYSLFTGEEQARLSALPLAGLASRLDNTTSSISETTKNLTRQELEDFYCFTELQEALIDGDEKEATYWRLRLSMTQEELIARFRSLDLSRLPGENEPTVQVQRRHIIYTLSQTHHRVYFDGGDPEQLCAWIEYYQLQGW